MSTAEGLQYAHKSVLLIPKCNTPTDTTSPSNHEQITNNNHPVNQPDIKLLDPVEIDDKCVNTLELVPSTDALIEVPIKKTFRKPKVYETTTEISITPNEDPFEMILFKGKPKTLQETVKINDDTTDTPKEPYNFKLDFEKVPTTPSQTTPTTDKPKDETNISETATTFTDFKKDVETADDVDYEPIETTTFNDFSKDAGLPDDGEYEPIETTYVGNFDLDSDKNYSFFEKYPDIWWEGAYRNLSIVPEEDEENTSLLGSISSHKTSFSLPSPLFDKKHPSEDIYTQEFYKSSTSNPKSDSLSFFSSSSEEDNTTVEPETKIPRAEVKLLVKSDTDNKSIEVRSVREFIKDTNGKTKMIDRKKRSQTLPNRFSDSISTISNKLNSFLDKKKSSSYSFLSDNLEPEEPDTPTRPSFTLQRLFVRTKDTLMENPNKELLATSKEKFPLNYDLSAEKNKPKVDLYANLPFYPCYDQYPLTKSGPVISFPTHTDSESRGAYCDWLLQKEDNREGKVD